MKIGYHKYKITPTGAVHMAGYGRQKKSTGILDPIEINTLVISIQNQFFILSILDSIIMENSVIIPVKNAISEKYNISQDQIIIGCIHTHSAPAYFKPFFENVEIEEELQQSLIIQFIDSINQAMTSLEDATYQLEKTTIKGLYGNRNEMNGYSNKDVIAIHFIKNNETLPFFTLLSMACHPTILNGTNLKLSADLIGAIRLLYQEKYQHECMIINGCCGDVSTRFYRQLSGEAELTRVSHEIIDQFNNLNEIYYPMTQIQSSHIVQEYTFDGRTHEFTQMKISELQKTIQEHPDTQDAFMAETLLKSLLLKVKMSPMTLSLKSNIVIMGKVIFISLPGDITAILGKRIQDAFSDYLVILIGYCENYSNYFVCEEDYGKYFETYISRLNKGNADTFIQSIINETNQLINA